ncbi:glycan biosynthesis hexose transferase WsfD [Amycolatopsis solani]|uniref:glycan biosynthesis hexose transferase WsfD n=1 Tax=Amycolatopsis solani TaxID=3028615 RepID=UPI0025AFF6DE|nr:hypothetical protein [Amycolatopsis sp. MEP2-6]
MKRGGIATATAAIAALVLALVLGLLGGTPTGAGDNGDGYRLFCGPGLTPATPDHKASWLGGVVLDFGRGTPCPDPQPSSAAVLFESVAGGDGSFSLVKLGWLYVLLVFLVTLPAAWAVQARGTRRLLFLLPPLLPLLEPSFARLFISTFAEPAGLFGAYTLLCGLAVIAATKAEDGFARLAALGLVAAGGVVGGLAKIGFLPLFVLAVLVCAVTAARPGLGRWWSGRIVGPVLAVLLVLELIAPIRANLAWQDRNYADVNAVNVVYTLGLVEFPGSAAALGLPAEAQQSAGHAYYPDGPEALAGADVLLEEPATVKHKVWDLLLTHPGALASAIGTGLQATLGRSLPYLPDDPWTAETRPPDNSAPVSGDMGGDATTFQAWLDSMGLWWWPVLLVLLGLAAAVVALRRGRPPTTRYGVVAGVAVASALGIVTMSVVGDGYFEIAKHVWLAAYLLDVAALSLCVVAAPVVFRWGKARWDRRRAGATPPEPDREPDPAPVA